MGDPWPEWALRLHEAWLAFRERLEAKLQASQGPLHRDTRGDTLQGVASEGGKPHPAHSDGAPSATELNHTLCLQLSRWHCEWVEALPLSGPDLASAQALVERTRAWLHHEALIDDIDKRAWVDQDHGGDVSKRPATTTFVPAQSSQRLSPWTLLSLREFLHQALDDLTLILSKAPGLGPLVPGCSAPASGFHPAAHTASTDPPHPNRQA